MNISSHLMKGLDVLGNGFEKCVDFAWQEEKNPNFKGVKHIWQLQRQLSFCSAMPIFGILFFTPIKAVVSVAQIVAGCALTVFCVVTATALYAVNKKELGKKLFPLILTSQNQVRFGVYCLKYSFLNFITLSALSYMVEVHEFKSRS